MSQARRGAVWLDGRRLQKGFKRYAGLGPNTYVAELAPALDAEARPDALRLLVEKGAELATRMPRSRFVEAPALGGSGPLATHLRQHLLLATHQRADLRGDYRCRADVGDVSIDNRASRQVVNAAAPLRPAHNQIVRVALQRQAVIVAVGVDSGLTQFADNRCRR